MKYFVNITTAEELKNKFRALSQTLHPDKGGNAQEFAEMLNEYETACKNLGAWTKKERAAVAGLRRGSLVVFFGPGMSTKRYVCTSCRVDGKINYMSGGSIPRYIVELVELMSDEKANGAYLEHETEPEDIETSAHQKADGVRPLSKKFGIGYYWDDVDGKIYTEEEIKHAEELASVYEAKATAKRAELQEAKEKAEAERLQNERVIIAQWSHILEAIPEGAKDATRKAILKRNICKVFAHYFQGVKVSVKDTSKCWCEHSEIIWTDGPTVEEVEAVDVLRYFLAFGWCAPSAYDDYGHRTGRTTFSEWRERFGAFSDDDIQYTRNLSESAAATVAEVIDAFEYEPRDSEGRITNNTGSRLFTWSELQDIAKGLGIDLNDTRQSYSENETTADKFRSMCARRDEGRNENGESVMRIYRQSLEEFAKSHYKVSATMASNEDNKSAEPMACADVEGVQIVDYSAKACAIFDELAKLPEDAKALGRYNSHLTDPRDGNRKAGYIFSKRNADKLRDILGTSQDVTREDADRIAEEIDNAEALRESAQKATEQVEERRREEARNIFERARREFLKHEQDNEHTAAVHDILLAMVKTLSGELVFYINGLDEELKEIEKRHEKRGNLSREDYDRRNAIQQEAHRVAVEQFGEDLAAVLFGSCEQATKEEGARQTTGADLVVMKYNKAQGVSVDKLRYKDETEARNEIARLFERLPMDAGKVHAMGIYYYTLKSTCGPLYCLAFVDADKWRDNTDYITHYAQRLKNYAEDMKANAEQMKPEGVEALASLCAIVSELVQAVKEYNETANGLRPDIAQVLGDVLRMSEDKARTLATACAVLAGFYPDRRKEFDEVGRRAWCASPADVPGLLAELITTARAASDVLADYIESVAA